MPVFNAQSKEGKLSLGSEYSAARFRQFLKDNVGVRLKITPQLPESNQLRRFYFGAVVPLVTYYQDNLDYRNNEDRERVHEWLKIEFNGEILTVAGKKIKVGKSTKGNLKGYIERVIDWMAAQGYPIDTLNPDEYKRFIDEIYSDGMYDDYISYLVDMGRMPWRGELSTTDNDPP